MKNISKTALIDIFFRLNNKFFPFLFAAALIFSSIEIFTYPGLVKKIFFLPKDFYVYFTYFSVFLTILGNIFFLKDKSLKIPRESKLLFYLCKLIIIPLLVIYLSFFILEIKNYPNYIFSTYHIHLTEIKSLIILLIFFITAFSDTFYQVIRQAIKQYKFLIENSFGFIVPVLVVVYLIGNVSKMSDSFIVNLVPIFTRPNATYDEKMQIKYGLVYEYLSFVKDNTPSNAKIVIPPQENPWLSVGNKYLVRYFLYPREILKYESVEEADYIMIAKGSWILVGDSTYGWPKTDIEAEKILIYDVEAKKHYELEETTYHHEDHVYSWGLIKLL